jgi:hypothetical protein
MYAVVAAFLPKMVPGTFVVIPINAKSASVRPPQM